MSGKQDLVSAEVSQGEEESPKKDQQRKIQEDEYIIEWGPMTIEALLDATRTSMKVFWDGSVSVYAEARMANESTKEFVHALAQLRIETMEIDVPAIALFHG